MDASYRRERALEPDSILVVIYQGIGDLVLATPALAALRQRFPRATICLAGRTSSLEILAHEALADERVALDRPLRPASASGPSLGRVLATLRRRRFDLLINLTTLLNVQTWLKCKLLNRLCSPRQRIEGSISDCLTFSLRRERVAYRHSMHEAAMKFHLLRKILPPVLNPVPRLSIAALPEPVRRLVDLGRAASPDTLRIAVSVGGARQSRQWPIQRCIECLREIQRRRPASFHVLGDASDSARTAELVAALGPAAVSCAGEVPVRDLPAFIHEFDVLLANDSGVAHVAAAVGTPLVVVFGAESRDRYLPIAPLSRLEVFGDEVPCSPCIRASCSHQRCIAGIAPDAVASAVIRLARKRRHVQPGLFHDARTDVAPACREGKSALPLSVED